MPHRSWSHQPQRIHVHDQIPARDAGLIGVDQHCAQRRIEGAARGGLEDHVKAVRSLDAGNRRGAGAEHTHGSAALALDESRGLEELAAETSILLEPGEEENRVLLDGEDVTGLIRNPTVTEAASRVSVFPKVRAWMVGLQKQLGAKGGVVMEGRDIGTVVFPHAEVKIFLDAAPEVRGQRRYDQLGQLDQKGSPPPPPPEEIVRDLRARDQRDRNRADSPLKPAADSVLLDSTNLTLEQAVAEAVKIVDEKLGAVGLSC